MTMFLEPDSVRGSLIFCVALLWPLCKHRVIYVMQELVLKYYQIHQKQSPLPDQNFHAATAQRLQTVRSDSLLSMTVKIRPKFARVICSVIKNDGALSYLPHSPGDH